MKYLKKITKTRIAFITDILLLFLGHKRCATKSMKSIKSLALEFTPSELRRLLLLHAVDQMTSVRQTIARDYQSLGTIVTTDIQAMYAYRCGQYDRCLHLTEQNVSRFRNSIALLHVSMYRGITHLMDDDLSSFSAVCTLTRGPRFDPQITQQTLSLYLLIKSKLKLRQSVASLVTGLANGFHSGRLNSGSDDGLLSFIYRQTIINIRRRTRRHQH